jgi:transketolase
MIGEKNMGTIDSVKKINEIAAEMRRDCIEMGYGAGGQGAHFGPALGCVDIVAALYFGVMNHDPKNPEMKERDRFIMSKGHACLSYYAALIEAGYISKDLIPTFKGDESILCGHPSINIKHGIEISSGSLGNGFSIACGMAKAAKIKGENHNVYCVVGDGESNEGVVYEAAINAVKYKLDNMITVIDRNGFQLSGTTKEVMDIDIPAIWKAYGWDVSMVDDGNDIAKVIDAVTNAKNKKNGKPQLIIADTVKGKGISFMERVLKWHASPITQQEYEQAVEDLETAKKGV